MLSIEPEQWAWSWTGFGQWGAAVYVAAVNLAIFGSVLLIHTLRSPRMNMYRAKASGR